MRLNLLLSSALCLSVSGCATPKRAAVPSITPNVAHDPLKNVDRKQLYEQGLTFAEASDWNRAEQYLLAAKSRGMDEATVTPHLVDVCIRASRYRAALQYAQAYIQKYPTDSAMKLVTATLQMAVGELLRASQTFEELLALKPDHAHAHYLYATHLREKMGNMRLAIKHYEKYLALNPNGEHSEEARVYMKVKP